MNSWRVFSTVPGLLVSAQQKLANIITVTIIGFYYFLWLLGVVVSEYVVMGKGNILVT